MRLKVKVLVIQCVQLFVTLWTVARLVPVSVEFSRQEYWSGLPFSSLGELPDPGIEPGSSYFAGRFFFFFFFYHLSHQGSPIFVCIFLMK